jgi:DNA-binding NarL/FixJ family response regulator
LLTKSTASPETEERLGIERSVIHKRVLVADDLAQVRSAVAALLKDSFNVVSMVADGNAALAAIIAFDPDLAILDISMPGLSGIEVARELKRHGNRAKIVFLTVHQDSEIIGTCLSTGALGYVLKERMDSDLLPAMNDALEGRIFVSRLSS